MKNTALLIMLYLCIIAHTGFTQTTSITSGDTVLWQDFGSYNSNPTSIGWFERSSCSPFDSLYQISLTGDDGSWISKGFGNVGTSGAAGRYYSLGGSAMLITPLINLSGGTSTLEFDAALTRSFNTDPWVMYGDDTLFVVVSEDGATSTSARFTRSGVVHKFDTSVVISNTGNHYNIDLSSFSNRDSVHVAFYAKETKSNGSGYYIFLDNIYIRKTNPGDYAVLNFETFRSYYFYNQDYTTTALIKNWGTANQTNVPVILFVDDTPVDTAYVSLDGGAQLTASFNWTTQVEGPHTLKVKTMLDGDASPDNDSILRPMVVFKNHWQQIFYDDFSAGTDNWSVANLSTYNGAEWMMFGTDYPYYQLNEYCFTNVFAANDSADGTGWTHTSATFSNPANAAGMNSLILEYDYDFATWIPPFFFDYCYIAGSTNGGSTWDTLMTDTVSQRAAHNTLDISDYAGQSSILLKFIYNESGGYNKWWAIDNVIIRGRTAAVGIKESPVHPNSVVLYPNYPNPFNPSTVISYQLPVNSQVSLNIFNSLGQEVITLVNEKQSAGFKQVMWDGKDKSGNAVSSGIYIYRIVAGNFVKTNKMMLVK